MSAALKQKSADRFEDVRTATAAHRAKHGCGAYSHRNPALLAVLAGAANAKRILELGTALGYTALWLSEGAPDAKIDTIEMDAGHVELAREHIAEHEADKHITVHEGEFGDILPSLKPGYDVAFFDGFTPSPPLLKELYRLLRPRGLLISANANHGGEADRYVDQLLDAKTWLTAFVDSDRETAVSIRL